jgi:indole-3-acetate monooxygenase
MVTNAEVSATPIDYIERVQALAPIFAAGADHENEANELDPRLVDGLHGAGLFRMMLPAWLNGGAVDPLGYTAVVEEIARHDASAAWCVNQGSGCTMVVGNIEPSVARQIFGRPHDVLAWGPSPGAKAVAVEGGYRVNYNGAYASGSRHATWLGAMCLVEEADGRPRLRENGKQELRVFLFPKPQADVKYDWRVMGLRGTGSDSYTVKDLFVREDFSLIRDDEATRKEASPRYRYTSTMLYASGFAHVALGIARGFMADFMDLAVHKMPREARSSLRDTTTVQSEVALCRAKWESARGYLRACMGEAWEDISRGAAPSPEHRVAIRLASTFAIHTAKKVVDILYDAAGSHGIQRHGPFERRFRDIHAVTQQLQGRKSHLETVGRFMLGLPVDLSASQI